MSDKPRVEQESSPAEGESRAMPLPFNLGSGSWGRQILGALLGALAGQALLWWGPRWGVTFADSNGILIWGAALGALLASLGNFVKAGAVLRGEEAEHSPIGNLLAAFLGIAVLFAVVVGLLFVAGLFF